MDARTLRPSFRSSTTPAARGQVPVLLALLSSLPLAAGCASSAPSQTGPEPALEGAPELAEEAEAPEEAVFEPQRTMPIVYRSGPNSDTYHLADCSRLGSDPLPVPIDSAVRHLEPCSRCEPVH